MVNRKYRIRRLGYPVSTTLNSSHRESSVHGVFFHFYGFPITGELNPNFSAKDDKQIFRMRSFEAFLHKIMLLSNFFLLKLNM